MTTLDPQWVIAICAVITLLILWSSTIIGIAIWIMRRIDGVKDAILDDIKAKHDENRVRVDAMQRMLIRHETILDPEFAANGKHRSTGRQ